MEYALMGSYASAAATDDMNPHGGTISITSMSTVYPATPTEKQTMFLACCDLVCRTYPYINRIFFYDMGCSNKGITSTDPDDEGAHDLYDYNGLVASLKESLGRVLVQYYPLAGRLCIDKDDEGGRLQIDCSDQGVELVEATADLPFSHLQRDNFQYRRLFWKLATRSDMVRSDYTDLPILSIQVTKFKDGGLAIGVSLSHAVCDANSFYDFVRGWAESCRLGDEYERQASMLPKHTRTALSIENIESWVRKLMQEESRASDGSGLAKSSRTEGMVELLEKLKQCHNNIRDHTTASSYGDAPILEMQLEEEDHREPAKDEELVQRVFWFSREALEGLKEEANTGNYIIDNKQKQRETSNDIKGKPLTRPFTTFEAFCAHWWRAFIRAKLEAGLVEPDQEVFLLIPVNARRRYLDLPASYFGNCLDGAMARTSSGALASTHSLTPVAGLVRAAITTRTSDPARFLAYVVDAEAQLRSPQAAIPHFGRHGLFHVSDSPLFPVYRTDFGWGPPSAVRAEGFRFGAEVQILEAPPNPAGEKAGFQLFCALPPAAMLRLQQDPSFVPC